MLVIRLMFTEGVFYLYHFFLLLFSLLFSHGAFSMLMWDVGVECHWSIRSFFASPPSSQFLFIESICLFTKIGFELDPDSSRAMIELDDPFIS